MNAAAAGRPPRTRDASGGVRAGDFDADALFAALDRQRLEGALSWRQVAEAVWAQSCELNVRRNDHPIAVETIRGMQRRNNVSCQHALFMLRWIDQAPEEFIAHPVAGSAGVRLPVAGPDRRLRWDLGALYDAMNARRGDDDLTWKSLADLLGCTQSQLSGIRTARFAIGMRLAMRITQWLARPASAFVYAAECRCRRLGHRKASGGASRDYAEMSPCGPTPALRGISTGITLVVASWYSA